MAYNGNPSSSTVVKQGANLNHEPLIKTERLSSFKLPRDLTLGGSLNSVRIPKPTATPKRVYAPNINVVRNKNTEVKTSRDTTIRGRGRGRGDRGKADRGGRGGRGGGKNSLVQTSGLFSEGTGETHLRKSSAVYSRGDKSDSVSSLRRPTIVKRDIKVDPEVEQKSLNEILGDFDEDCDDVTMVSDYYTPVALDELKKDLPTVKVENDNKHSALSYPEDLSEFFGRQQPQLFILQLPDSLPGEGPDEEPADSADQERSSSPDPSSRYCTVKQLNEGLIGKIVRYKSGKSKLIIGQTRFDIDLGMDPGLLQEAMSVTTNRTERSGNLINLGQIKAKLNAIPDWEYMLKDKS